MQRTFEIGPAVLHVVVGDLFDVPATAVVNSEQSDFRLAGSSATISGQIRRRYGAAVDDDLLTQTRGRVLARGTVLLTRSGEPGRPIYHAGFHEPSEWLSAACDDEETEYVEVVRGCIRTILNRLRSDGIDSVAFPLLATGLFGLDPVLLLDGFMREVVAAARAAAIEPGTGVWLVLQDVALEQPAVDAVVRALSDLVFARDRAPELTLGVGFLDRHYASSVVSEHDPWFAWMLCRHAELIVSFLASHLSGHVDGWLSLERLREEQRPKGQSLHLSFGQVRSAMQRTVSEWGTSAFPRPWPRHFAALVAEDVCQRRLVAINEARNDIAHGRRAPRSSEILERLREFLHIASWNDAVRNWGTPRVEGLEPWIVVRSVETQLEAVARVFVLERASSRSLRYVDPLSGLVLELPALPHAGG